MILRLAIRLIRGGGGTGLVRAMLVICGIALGVVATCLVAILPSVLSHRADVMNARNPSPVAADGDASFSFSMSTDVWDGRRLGRVFLADVRPGTPSAPGVEQLPGPSEIVASPALARALETHNDLRFLVPGKVVGVIDHDGLIDRDELFAYIGLPANQISDPHGASGFGARDVLALQRQQTGLTQSLALLVLPPVVAYLVICGRLAAGTRSRRYAALQLLGLRRSLALRTAFVESALFGAVGAAAGVGLFLVAHPALADSGLLGFTWFPEGAGLGPALTFILIFAVSVASGLVSAAGVRRSLHQPLSARKDTEEPKARPWLLIPLVFGFGAVSYLLASASRPTPADYRLAMADGKAYIAIAAVVIMVLGLLVGLQPIVAFMARALSLRFLPLPARMAGSRLALQPAATLRILIGLSLLILVSGVSSGVLRDMELRSTPYATNYSVDIEAGSASDGKERRAIFDLPAEFKWNVQSSTVDLSNPPTGEGTIGQARAAGYRLVTIGCDGLSRLIGQPLPQCHDGKLYRIAPDDLAGTSFEVPAGTDFEFADGSGAERTVTVPNERIIVPKRTPFPIQAFGGLYLARDGPAFGWSANIQSSFL